MILKTLPFSLVDVFAREPLSGNGLSVFLLDEDLSTPGMQRVTQEMRQFESIFLRRIDGTSRFDTRIFTMEEELPFAGHPVIGAAAWLHAELFAEDLTARMEFITPQRNILATSHRKGVLYFADMDQGIASFEPALPSDVNEIFLKALNLSIADHARELPFQVVSTGLPYLIVPIRSGIESAQIMVPDFAALLATVGARFVYIVDVDRREGRSWDNQGRVEDIATGSAAGPAAAYLVRHGKAKAGDSIVLNQGRFVNRPSDLHAMVSGDAELSVSVRGQVCFAGSGALRLPARLIQPIHTGVDDPDAETTYQ